MESEKYINPVPDVSQEFMQELPSHNSMTATIFPLKFVVAISTSQRATALSNVSFAYLLAARSLCAFAEVKKKEI